MINIKSVMESTSIFTFISIGILGLLPRRVQSRILSRQCLHSVKLLLHLLYQSKLGTGSHQIVLRIGQS